MSEFSYYATFDESITLLRDLVKQCNVHLIPDQGTFHEPSAPSYNEVNNEVIEQLRRRRVLFLAGSFTKHPPMLVRRHEGSAAGTYFISIPQGGPLMQMTLAMVNVIEGQSTQVRGTVSYQRWYENPDTGLDQPASTEVKQAFKCIVSTMKKRLVQHQLAMKIWITPNSLELLQKKETRIIDKGVLLA